MKFEQKEWDFRRIEEEIKCWLWNWCTSKGETNMHCSFQLRSNCRLSDV